MRAPIAIIAIDGDCVTVSCPAEAPYPVGTDQLLGARTTRLHTSVFSSSIAGATRMPSAVW